MKKFKTTFVAVMLGLLVSGFAFAGQTQNASGNNYYQPFRVGMYRVKNTLMMNVLVEKEKDTRVHIRLLDSNGKILHQEYVGKGIEKIGQKFDFSEISDGNYKIEIVSGEEKIVKNVSLATTEIAEVAGRKLVALN
ncbi:hypothetical protein Dfri01_43440 [Dyadobacter frigoris]|uniref:hypothetical protein n=1 Tax=Dyadobacter frigoris TaxID=2576211 RepID=UPI0024A3D67D|nr:hypothetical protein [Dyadobacter frigoris]GLU54883.1 hypothetical protein Dfri01_43440 [Dyadobacter frigoris]